MTFLLTQPQETDPNYQTIMGVVGTLKGLPNWSAPIDHIGLSSSTRFAHITRNLSTGGHQQWNKSTDNSELVAITDAGLRATALTISGLLTVNSLAVTTSATIGTTLGVTGTSTLGVVNAGATAVTTLTASSTVQGTRLISTVAIGTAPLTVTSTTKVTNLNADLLDGIDSTGFLTPAQGDTAYVNVIGDTMTGALNIQAASALKLQGVSGLGGWVLNATNIADPVLEFRDNSGDLLVAFNPSGSTYAADVNLGTIASNAARFTGDVLITTDLGVRTVNATTNLNATANVTGAKIVAGGTTFSGSEKFRVISGTSLFGGDVTMSSGTLAVSSGNIDVQSGTSGQLRVGAVIVNAASLSGSEKLLVSGGFRVEDSGSARIETNGTGLGFFSAPPISRPTVTGSRGGNAALLSFLTAVENLGLILNSTTA